MSQPARFAVFLAVVLTVWAAQHLYVGWRLLGLPLLAEATPRRVMTGFLLAGLLSYPLAQVLLRTAGGWPAAALHWLGASWMGTLFLLLAAFLAADLLTLGGVAFKPWVPWVRTGAAGLAVVAAAVALVGGHLKPRIVEVEATLPGLPPEADGLTLVQVSDLHLGGSVGAGRLRRVVDRVLALDPDLVAVTGDVVDGHVPAVAPMLPELARLRARLDVLAVLGNHEFYAGAAPSRQLLRAAGFTLLDNAAVEVCPGLWVAGVPDPRGARETGGGPSASLAGALATVPPGAAVILLQHSPEAVEAAAGAGVGLMLSGHTHGGQIWPFTHAVRAVYPHVGGVYRVGAMTHVVSRGAGLWGPPMRLFAPADIVRVTLRAADR